MKARKCRKQWLFWGFRKHAFLKDWHGQWVCAKCGEAGYEIPA